MQLYFFLFTNGIDIIMFFDRIKDPVDPIHQIENKQQQAISPQEEMCTNRKKIAELLTLEESELQVEKIS